MLSFSFFFSILLLIPLKIAIFGGTFNPIHMGHLRLAQTAVQALGLTKVFFTPCFIPPHKNEIDLLPAHHRLAMILLAIARHPKFKALTFEIDRGGISYTVNTVHYVQKQNPDSQLFFIIGSDNFQTIGHWQQFRVLVTLCDFFVVKRPGYPLQLPPSSVPKKLLPLLRYHIAKKPMTPISSSEIRQRFAKGEKISHLLSPVVYRYIRTHHLY